MFYQEYIILYYVLLVLCGIKIIIIIDKQL